MENQKSVTDLIEEVREEICNKYCKYYDMDHELAQDDLEEICKSCPLNKL